MMQQDKVANDEHVIPYNSTTNSLLHQIDPNSLPDPREVCTFCQEELQYTPERKDGEDEKIIVETTCGHHFCSKCVNGYLTHLIKVPNKEKKFKCPNCVQEWKIVWDPEGATPPERERRRRRPIVEREFPIQPPDIPLHMQRMLDERNVLLELYWVDPSQEANGEDEDDSSDNDE